VNKLIAENVGLLFSEPKFAFTRFMERFGFSRHKFAREAFAFWLAALLPFGLAAAPALEPDIRRDASVRAIEMVLPSVVNISTETLVQIRDPLQNMIEDFFGPYYRRRPEAQKSLGSGVIIDENGYILTNYHVVQRASRITVTLSDGREFQATPVSAIAKADLALLQLKTSSAEKFPAIRIAADDDLILGETVLALGNPFGLGESVSRGILSSKTRRPPNQDDPAELDVQDWLQTDAAINPGNSGGPLVNLRGELIGLNVAVFREAQGIGFAVPAKRISEALSKIFTPEAVRALWFGAQVKPAPSGLAVSAVESKSPAEQAGLRVGDRIARVNEKPVRSAFELNRELIAKAGNQLVTLGLERDHKIVTLSVRLQPVTQVLNAKLVREKTGAVLREMTAQLAAAFGVEPGAGLLVDEVDPNSPAAAAGLRPGFILQTIDGEPVHDIVSAAKILHAKKKNEQAALQLLVQSRRGVFLQQYTATASVVLR